VARIEHRLLRVASVMTILVWCAAALPNRVEAVVGLDCPDTAAADLATQGSTYGPQDLKWGPDEDPGTGQLTTYT